MKYYFSIFFWCCLPLLSLGESLTETYPEKDLQTPVITPADWEKATEGLDYGTAKRVPPKEQEAIEGLEFLEIILKIFGVLCVVVLIVFLLRSFVGLQGVERAKNKTFDPNEKIDTQTVADHIHEFDLSTLIQQAIQQADYTTATRLYYLLAIRTLSEKQLIQWKKDKTNRNYINELGPKTLKTSFRELTHIFERVWYGEGQLDGPIFKKIEAQFEGFIRKLSLAEATPKN